MRSRIEASGRWAVAHPRRVLAGVVLAILLCVPGLLQLQISADISGLLPKDTEASRGLARVVESFGEADSLFGLLERSGPPADDGELLRLGEALKTVIEALPEVKSVRIRPPQALPLGSPARVLGLAEGPTREALEGRLSPEGLRARARGLKTLLSGPLDRELRSLLVRDPLGLWEIYGERLKRGLRHSSSSQDGFVSPDGSALLVFIEASSAEATSYHESLVDGVRAEVAAVLRSQEAPEQWSFGLTGSIAYARDISRATRAEAFELSLVSLAAILVLYLVFYRSLLSLLLIVVLLPLSAVLTLGLAGYLYGSVNPLAAGFVAILFGLGIDPAIHLISRYREELLSSEPSEAARRAVAAVGPAVAVASGTTAAALMSIQLTDPGEQGQIGVLAGLGVLINAVLMGTALPALWVLLGRRIPGDAQVGMPLIRRIVAFLERYSGAVVLASAAAVVLTVAFVQPLSYDGFLTSFQPADLEPVATDKAIRERFEEDDGQLLLLVEAVDEQVALQSVDSWTPVLRRAVDDGVLRGFDGLSVLRASETVAAERRQALDEAVGGAASLQAFRQALREEGFRSEPFEPALLELEERWLGELSGQSPLQTEILPVESQAGAGAEPGWADFLEERHLARSESGVRVLTLLYPEGDPSSAAEVLRLEMPARAEGVEVHLTGTPLVEVETKELLAKRVPLLTGFASCILIVVLSLYYRRLRVVLLAYVPLCVVLGAFLAVHAALGWPITPFVLAAMLLLVGVGIDDHVFMMDRYLEGDRRSTGRLEETLGGAGRAISVTTLTTLAAFGVLWLSHFPALAAFGRAAVLALAMAFLGSVVLLPALLVRFLPPEDAPPQ